MSTAPVRRLLVVEDELVGFAIEEAGDRRRALDGISLCQAIRKDGRNPQTSS